MLASRALPRGPALTSGTGEPEQELKNSYSTACLAESSPPRPLSCTPRSVPALQAASQYRLAFLFWRAKQPSPAPQVELVPCACSQGLQVCGLPLAGLRMVLFSSMQSRLPGKLHSSTPSRILQPKIMKTLFIGLKTQNPKQVP